MSKHLFEVDLALYEKGLQEAARKLLAARVQLDDATELARSSALAAIAAGMPERQVSRLVGISIPTLRKWQGKK